MLARERFAWVQLTALVLIFGVYFVVVSVLQRSQPGPTFLQQIGILAIASGSLGVIVLADRMRTWFGPERKVKPDERDRLIEYRASAIAYYVLMGGMLYVGCFLPFVASGWKIVNATLFFVVVAEIVHHGLIVLGYRRGLRG